MTPPPQQGVTTSSPMFSVGGYNGGHPNNDPYGMHDEESLNWHQKAGYHGMMPLGAYSRGGYDDDPALSNPMGPDFQFAQAASPTLGTVGSAVKQGVMDPFA
jgi:hypothetical protein